MQGGVTGLDEEEVLGVLGVLGEFLDFEPEPNVPSASVTPGGFARANREGPVRPAVGRWRPSEGCSSEVQRLGNGGPFVASSLEKALVVRRKPMGDTKVAMMTALC